jgi:hypothetical protein
VKGILVVQSFRGLALAIALTAGAALPMGARAQTPEAEALGQQVAHSMFKAIAFDEVIAKEMKGAAGAFTDVKSRPEWGKMLEDSMTEEVRHDMPVFERMLGHALAQNMSPDELRAGVVIIADPATQSLIAAGSAAGEDRPEPKLARETERVAASPPGRRFLQKFEKLETYLTPIQDDLVAELLPGAFRRFADKVEAGEEKRRAARP